MRFEDTGIGQWYLLDGLSRVVVDARCHVGATVIARDQRGNRLEVLPDRLTRIKDDFDAEDRSWRKLIKVPSWRGLGHPFVTCGIDADGDFGILDDQDYSIMISQQGAERLRDWLCKHLGPPREA